MVEWRTVTHVEYCLESDDGIVIIDIEPTEFGDFEWHGHISGDPRATVSSIYDHAATAEDAKRDAEAWIEAHRHYIENIKASKGAKA